MSDDAANEAAAADVAPVSGQITIAVMVLIVAVFIAILVLYLRSKGYSGASSSAGSSRRSSRALAFAQQNESASRRNALDRSILESLPVAVYRVPGGGECGLECAVCICELAEGEEARFLPKCNHAFHVECIDMWFGSNSTCPLCRLPVAAYSSTNDVPTVANDCQDQQGSTSSSSPSSSSSSSGRKELVIEIPRRAMEGTGFSSAVSPLPSSRRTPVVERLKSLGRMMSIRGRGKGVCSTTPTPRPAAGSDIEQGRIDDDVSKQQ